MRTDLECVEHRSYLSSPDAFRLSRAQPVGRTAAASAILMMSPGMKRSTASLKLTSPDVFVMIVYHAQPVARIRNEPTAKANTALWSRLSQPNTAYAPYTI